MTYEEIEIGQKVLIEEDVRRACSLPDEYSAEVKEISISRERATLSVTTRDGGGEVVLAPFGSLSLASLTKDSATKIKEVFEAMRDLVLEKNKRYGDSALKPKQVFSKLDSTESIKVRLDDKLSRIRNSDELRPNDICDLIGYLGLLLVANEIDKETIMNLID